MYFNQNGYVSTIYRYGHDRASGPVVISWIAEVPSGYGSPHKSAASMYRHLAQLLKNVKFLDVKM